MRRSLVGGAIVAVAISLTVILWPATPTADEDWEMGDIGRVATALGVQAGADGRYDVSEILCEVLTRLDINCPTSHAIINEVEMNPPGEDSGAEWIEILNPTADPVNLTGWAASYTANVGGDGWDDLPGVVIASEERYLFIYPVRHLENSRGEVIRLRNAAGEIVDETPIGLTDTDDDSRTWQRIPDGKESNSKADWLFVEGTPGGAN